MLPDLDSDVDKGQSECVHLSRAVGPSAAGLIFINQLGPTHQGVGCELL